MTCFNNNSIKTLASLLLGGTAILGTHLGGAFAQDVHMAGDPYFDWQFQGAEGQVQRPPAQGSLDEWEDLRDLLYGTHPDGVDHEASATGLSRDLYPASEDGVINFAMEQRLSGGLADGEIRNGEFRVEAIDMDWDTPSTNVWFARMKWGERYGTAAAERAMPTFGLKFTHTVTFRVVLDKPKLVRFIYNLQENGDIDDDNKLRYDREAGMPFVRWTEGFVEDAFSSDFDGYFTASEPIVDFDGTLRQILPAGTYTIGVKVKFHDTEWEEGRCDCPQPPCPNNDPGEITEEEYIFVGILDFRDIEPLDPPEDTDALPAGARSFEGFAPSMHAMLNIGDRFAGDQGGQAFQMLNVSIPASESENAHSSASLGAWTAGTELDWQGELIQTVNTHGVLRADGVEDDGPVIVKADASSLFAYDFTADYPMNFDLGIERTDEGEHGWNHVQLTAAVFEISSNNEWDEVQPERVAQDGSRIRYELKEGRTYAVNANLDLFAEAMADGTFVERCLDESIKLRSSMRLMGDINGDGTVDGADLSELLGSWGTDGFDADLNSNGTIDGQDLAVLLGNWIG